MSSIDEIINRLDLQQLALAVGADPAEVEAAARHALPTLLLGLNANAADGAGAQSIVNALSDHDPSLLDGTIDPSKIDTEDGAKITHHIFGQNEDQVVNQLGGLAGDSKLMQKLLPMLAPIVMAWLASKFDARRREQAQAPQQSEQAGQPQAQQQPSDPNGPFIKPMDGTAPAETRAEAPAPQAPTQQAPQQAPQQTQQPSGGDILSDILGQVLGGGAGGQQQAQQPGGGALMDILGQLLGGGRR